MSIGTAVTATIISLYNTAKPLVVPAWQREYAWGEDEIEDYWNDIMEIHKINSDKAEHFIGAVVLCTDKENNCNLIIDGQQRLTTTYITLYRIIETAENLLRSGDVTLDNAYIQQSTSYFSQEKNKLIGWKSISQSTRALVLSERNNSFFDNMLNNSISQCTDQEKDANDKLIKADTFIKKNINEHIMKDDFSTVKEKVEELSKLLITIESKLEVIRFDADTQSDAHKVFETLNARGKDLETADLIKNYLYSLSVSNSDLQKAVNSTWKNLLNTFNTSRQVTKYIRYYWNATQSFSTENDLYSSIKMYIDTDLEKAKKFLTDLDYCKNIYAAFLGSSIKGYGSTEVNELVAEMQTLSTITFVPILIALKLRDDITEQDVKHVLNNLINFIMRVTIIPGSGTGANTNERFFATIAREVSEKSILLSPNDIVEKLKEKDISDESVTSLFMDLDRTKKDQVRYILGKINDYFDKSNVFAFKTSKDVNIEHIYPSNPDSSWDQLAEEDIKYVEYIGNKTLWAAKDNKALKNKPFAEKQVLYDKCGAKITKDLATLPPSWGIEEIKTRQKQFAEVAPLIWKLG